MITKDSVICVDCSRVMVIENHAVKISAESMAGYQLGSLRRCPKCGTKIITQLSTERGPYNSDRERLDYYFKRLPG
jgi:DNA-directed RNA polymerase subunit RPC12/RpoP